MIVSIPQNESKVLTPNQKRILKLYREGLSEDEIAHKLRMSNQRGTSCFFQITETVSEAIAHIRAKGYDI
jgi:transcriptional regulator